MYNGLSFMSYGHWGMVDGWWMAGGVWPIMYVFCYIVIFFVDDDGVDVDVDIDVYDEVDVDFNDV